MSLPTALIAAVLALPAVTNAQETPTPFQFFWNALKPMPVQMPTEEYDGFELRYNKFVFRPAMFKFEAGILGFVLVYLLVYFYGDWYNSSKAKKWFIAHRDLYRSQFSKPGETSSILSDGATDLFQFSTGRRNVQSLHTVFTFTPRHDLFQTIFTYGWILYDLRYSPNDDVTLDFKLGTKEKAPLGNAPPFVWGIIGKDELNSLKGKRWDLGIAKTQDNATVPKSCVVMSEVADVTETILKSQAAVALLSALKNDKISRHFKSLSITDLPTIRPTGPIKAQEKERHVILSLKVPSSNSQLEDTIPLVEAVFGLIDWLESGKLSLRPETIRKLNTAREELHKDLLKEVTEEKEKEADDSKRAAKRKAEEERFAKLSAEQQRKQVEKEKKRALRKGTQKIRQG